MSAALAETVTRLRKAARMQKKQLAERAGVGIATIWRIERGQGVNTDTIELVFQALGHNYSKQFEREIPAAYKEG